MNFLDEILSSTSGLESPRSYFYWAGITSISAVIKKNIWLDRQKKYNLYPNIYTFLISKKSGLRKSLPVNLAKKLATLTGNVRIVDGQNTMQGVLKELSTVHTTQDQQVIAEANGFLVSGEFANFLIQDRDAKPLTDLTDMYDTQNYEEGFSKRLASQDTLILKGLCLTGMFGSNEVHFRNAVPDNAIRGGFLARCFCVYEEKVNTLNSLVSLTEEEEIEHIELPYGKLVPYLKLLASLRGAMRIENKPRSLYNEWYHDFRNREIEDETGTLERIGDSLLKAAMLISLARNPKMLISYEDMNEAITRSTECFSNIRKMILGTSATDKDTFRIVMAELLRAKNYECTREYLLVKGWGIYDCYSLDKTVETLMQSNAIQAEKRGSQQFYRLKDWVISRHNSLSGEKEKKIN